MTPKTAETFTTAQLYMGQPGDAPFPDPPPTVPLPARHSTSAPTAPLPSLPGRTEGSRSRGSDVSAIAIRRHLQVDDDDDSDNDDDDDDEQSQPSTPPSKILGRDSYASEDQQLPDPVTFAEKRGIIEAMLARIADLEARFSCVEAILGGLEHELALVVRGHDQNAVMKHGKIVDPATGKKPELRTRESQTQSPKSKMQQEQVQVDTEDGGFWHPENLTRYVSQSQGDFDKASTQTLVSIMSLLRGLSSIRQAKQAMASIDTVLSKLDLSASDN
ncbi:hypothetical protein FBU59_001942 [Linderina macrospora]|uniref:Uncharacterized protein n=1 Tax=Linderina macrospora TaxID=4868 RepID=A0ACC1JCP4_9FUNG|nr:hypothetical protein FBU59_001942 [Linderina macrospora]